MRAPPKHITILGGGLSGLSTAYHLSRALPASTKISLVEGTSRVGGWIDSQKHELGFKDKEGNVREGVVGIETGPRSIRPRGSRGAASMLKMLKDLRLENDIMPIPFSHPSAQNRFILDYSTSKLTALPTSLTSLLGRQPPLLKGLFSAGLFEPLKPKASKTHLTADKDESVDAFFRRRFGDNVADNLASAMVHGIYAASSSQLSFRSAFPSLWEAERKYGSVVVGMLLGTKTASEKAEEKREWEELGEVGKEREKWSLYGIKGGLSTMTDRLMDSISSRGVEIILGEPVRKIELSSNQEIAIHTHSHFFSTSHLISALPPRVLARTLSSPLPHLTHNPSTCVGVVNVVYPLPPASIHSAGFGYLVPRPPTNLNPNPSPNSSGVLGVIFDSTALPPNPPELGGQVTKLTLMMGGPYWANYSPRVSPPSDPEELLPLAIQHLNTIFPHLRNVKPILTVCNIHHNCIPTYLPGHGARLRELHEAIESGEWKGKLSLVGSGYGGVGVNDCVLSGVEVTRRLAKGKEVTGLEAWKDWE
ncbi:protoporphyrinogen oxidase [Cryptococcus neoformans Tu401-1]|nr:protoporphyrinogen oxidase [Cryptococcus neoformans var. grubii Bt85]OXG15291.1 protoporphyrinogen oxidase [Cryptococcus neoformans var. grubii Tu401-1]